MLATSITTDLNQSRASSNSKDASRIKSSQSKQAYQRAKAKVQHNQDKVEGRSEEKNKKISKEAKEGDGHFRWKLVEVPLTQEQSSAENYREVQVGYKWGTIDYRDSKYHGKILITETKCQTTSSVSMNSNFTNSIHNHQYTQTKDGPGVLILDSHLWIIGEWKDDNLVGKRSVYVISSDFGVLQLHLSQEGGTQEILARVKEFSYIGNTSMNETGTNGNYNSVYNKASVKHSKHIIMGDRVREGGKSEQNVRCKWVVDLSQQHQNIAKSNGCAYYLQTTSAGIDDGKIKEVSLDAEDEHGQRVGSFEYFISNLRKILIQSESSEYGFQIIQNKFTAVNTANINKSLGHSKTFTNNYNGIETIICSNTHNNESVYIRILSQTGKRGNGFTIDELAILSKEPVSSQSSNPQNLQISMPNLQSFTYTRKYSYMIKSLSSSLSNYSQSLTAILPQIHIEQRLEGRIKNDARYKYTMHYNCQQDNAKDISKGGTYMGSGNKEYSMMLVEKKRQHLCSINFVDKNHKNLLNSLHKILKEINFVYYKVKLSEMTSAENNLSLKGNSAKQLQESDKNFLQKYKDQVFNKQGEKVKEGEFMGRKRRNTINTVSSELSKGYINEQVSQQEIKQQMKIVQEGKQRSRSKGHNVNLNLQGIRNTTNIPVAVPVGPTRTTASARSNIQNTRFGTSGIRKRTYTMNTRQKDEQRIEQYVQNEENSSGCSGGTWGKEREKEQDACRQREQYKSTVYAKTNQKKHQEQSDGVDNEEENDFVEENLSAQKKPKERKYSQSPSQTPSIKSPSVCASLKSPSNSMTPHRHKQESSRPYVYVESSVGSSQNQFQSPSPSKSKISNTSECNSNMNSNRLDLLQLTKQYGQINSQMMREAKKNHIPLDIIKNGKDDCQSQYALTRSNTVSYQNIVRSGGRMNNLNSHDEQSWEMEYRNGSGSGNGNGGSKGNAVNTRKRTQSIYDDYMKHK